MCRQPYPRGPLGWSGLVQTPGRPRRQEGRSQRGDGWAATRVTATRECSSFLELTSGCAQDLLVRSTRPRVHPVSHLGDSLAVASSHDELSAVRHGGICPKAGAASTSLSALVSASDRRGPLCVPASSIPWPEVWMAMTEGGGVGWSGVVCTKPQSGVPDRPVGDKSQLGLI